MKKIRYITPLIEVIELDGNDIIRTSGLTSSVGGAEGSVKGSSSDSYDDNYNASAGGKITLN